MQLVLIIIMLLIGSNNVTNIHSLSCLINDLDSCVIQLTTDTYSQIYDSNQLWIINYYYGGGAVQPEHYKQLAYMFYGLIRVAALNCDIKHYLCKQNGVHQTTASSIIHFYGIHSSEFSYYHGKHTLDDLVQAASFAIKRRFQYKLSPKPKTFKQIIISLNDKTFDEYVLHSEHAWLVQFYSSSWGPFKAFYPIYERIARELRRTDDDILCGIIDIELEQQKAHEYNVQQQRSSPPTFKYFTKGIKSGGSVETYVGALDRAKLMEWITEVHVKTIPTPTVYQMIDEQTARKACHEEEDTTSLCIVTILPNLDKCNAECRHSYLVTLHNVVQTLKHNHNGWGWLWFVAGTQPDCERILSASMNNNNNNNDSEELALSKPQIFVLDIKQRTYWTKNSTTLIFTVDNLLKFLDNFDEDLTNEHAIPVNRLPTIRKYQLWDGESNDVSLEEEEKEEKKDNNLVKNVDEL